MTVTQDLREAVLRAGVDAEFNSLMREFDRLRRIEIAAEEVCSWSWKLEDRYQREDIEKLEAALYSK